MAYATNIIHDDKNANATRFDNILSLLLFPVYALPPFIWVTRFVRDDFFLPAFSLGGDGAPRVRVDPLGMAEADISSVVPCGSVRFRPV